MKTIFHSRFFSTKRHFFLPLFFFFSIISQNSFCQFFTEKFDYSGGVISNGTCFTTDGKIITTGGIETTTGGSPAAKMFLMKTDLNGSVLWLKKYYLPATTFDYGHDVTEMADGNYLFAGSCYSSSPFSNHISIIKTDSSGNIIWQKFFASPISSGFVKMALDQSDNIYILFNKGSPAGSFSVAKFDFNGDSLWTNIFSTPNIVSDGGIDMVITNTNEILVASNMFCNSGCQNALWTKIDANGNQVWTNGVDLLASPKIAAGNDSYFVLIPGGNIMKTDTSGIPIWSKQLGNCYVSDLVADSIGGVYIVGNYYDATNTKAFLAHSNSSGVLDVFKWYGHEDNNAFTELTLAENLLIISGNSGTTVNYENIMLVVEDLNGNCGTDTVMSFNDFTNQVYPFPLNQASYSPVFYSDTLVVLNDNLTNIFVCDPVNSIPAISESEKEHQVFPNPASNKITISAEEGARIYICDGSGRVIYSALNYNMEEIDLSKFPCGFYTVLIKTEKNFGVEKLILMN